MKNKQNINTESVVEVEVPTKENPVSAPRKQEVAGGSSETFSTEKVSDEPVEEIKENEQNDAGLPRSSAVTPELAKTTEIETPPTTPTQEIPVQPQIKTVEKIVYQTPPNFIQNLLNKARAKIQERKRKKLDKIMSLFELNSEISNSNIQKLLRTTKRSATRYLNILEKEQKIIQIGTKGRSVKYTKKQ